MSEEKTFRQATEAMVSVGERLTGMRGIAVDAPDGRCMVVGPDACAFAAIVLAKIYGRLDRGEPVDEEEVIGEAASTLIAAAMEHPQSYVGTCAHKFATSQAGFLLVEDE